MYKILILPSYWYCGSTIILRKIKIKEELREKNYVEKFSGRNANDKRKKLRDLKTDN